MRFLLPILAVVLGFAAGNYFAPFGANSADGDNQEAIGEGGGHIGQGNSTGRAGDKPPLPRPAQGDVSEQLTAAFQSGGIDYPSVKALMQALAAMSRENLPEFSSFFSDRPMRKQQIFLWQMYFAAWAELDPQGALAFIETRFKDPGSRRIFYAAVLKIWSGDSPDLALEFAIAKFRPDEFPNGAELALDFLREMVKTDPDKALQLATNLRDGEILFDLTAQKISQLGKEDWQLALEAVDKLPGAMHTHAASQLVADWAKEEPANAAAWLKENYVPEMGLHTLVQVAGAYLSSNPDMAMAWIKDLPNSQTHERILREGVAAWARENPAAAAEWVGNLELGQANDGAVVALSQQLSMSNPQAVIEDWVPRIADPRRGNELLYEVSLTWQRDEPDAYTRWLSQTSALSAETRQRLMARELPGPGANPRPAIEEPAGGSGRDGDQSR